MHKFEYTCLPDHINYSCPVMWKHRLSQLLPENHTTLFSFHHVTIFIFFTTRVILHTIILHCLATLSTSTTALVIDVLQVTLSTQHVVHLSALFSTTISHLMLLEEIITISILFVKSTTICPSPLLSAPSHFWGYSSSLLLTHS